MRKRSLHQTPASDTSTSISVLWADEAVTRSQLKRKSERAGEEGGGRGEVAELTPGCAHSGPMQNSFTAALLL